MNISDISDILFNCKILAVLVIVNFDQMSISIWQGKCIKQFNLHISKKNIQAMTTRQLLHSLMYKKEFWKQS